MNNVPEIDREQILSRLQAALEPLPHVLAMWQGGGAAFRRIDEWSDIDLVLATDDERVDELFTTFEETVAGISPIELRYETPRPSWHGHAQVMYRLENTSPYVFIDLVIMKASAEDKFLEPRLHGEVVVHFDKANIIDIPEFSEEALQEKLKNRVRDLRTTFDLYQVLTLKEVHRGHDIEALSFYQSFTLRPLIEALRIIHQPARHGFHTRYIDVDLPREIVERLRPMFFVSDAQDIASRRAEAEQLFNETLGIIEG